MLYGLALTETVDVLEVLILALFLGATALAAYNAADAWKNELAAIERGDPDVTLFGLEDLARAWVKLLFMALPGAVVVVLLMTIPSPMGVANPTPQALVAGLGLRVGLLLFALALVAVTGLSAWLRRRTAARWERGRSDGAGAAAGAAAGLPVVPAPVVVVASAPPAGPSDGPPDDQGRDTWRSAGKD